MQKLQPASINGVEFDALIDYERALETEIPDYPVEEGYSVQDSIILKPITISMTVFLTSTPVTFRSHGHPGRVAEVVQQLEQLYMSRELVTVSTSNGIYRNMGIVSITLPRSVENKTSMAIPIALKEVRTTGSKTVTIPAEYGRGGQTGANAGTANTTPVTSYGSGGAGSSSSGGSDEKGKSILKALADSVTGR